ncbi:HAUS augmin-like complex subunit 6 [Gastrophryne carolinensis]
MQSAPRCLPPWRKEHLWLNLQALGFGAEAPSLGKTLAHVTFGVNMFDKPNKDAFYVVFHFLFSKLNGAQSKEVFRYCWPPLDKKKDAEFRKACCEWLKKISEDAGNGFPQVVASIFLSPGGPKFVQLLYHFARYVMLQQIKRDIDGENSFIPDSLQCRVQDPQKALARNKMARHRYMQTLQKENFVIREYQKKAQLLVKQIRDLRSECVTLQNQYSVTVALIFHGKIRSLWGNIMQKLSAIEKEVEVVDSVVSGDADRFVLDGSKISLNIPNVLVTRIESEMHRLQMENVYEAGKVNLITIIQLLNEGLKLIQSERNCHGGKDLHVDPQYLAAKVKFETEVFTRLKHTRHKVKREDLVSINQSIVDKEKDWEKKWKRILGNSPFSLFKGLNPVLELQPPLAPFSFDPAAEEALKCSVFSQYPVSLPDMSGKDSSIPETEYDSFTSFMDATLFTPRGRKSLPFHNKMTPSQRRMSLNEKDFRTPTCSIKDRFLQRTPGSVQRKRADVTSQPSPSSVLPPTPTPCKQNAMGTARLHLAQQVADYIVNETPRAQTGRGMEIDELIGMLSSDPFLSKKEIPRTPEHLITDIRTSWRKAIQTEEFSDLSSPTEDPCVESPIEQESAHCSQVDLSMACFLSASHLSEHNESPDARVSPTTSESSPHGQAISSQNFLTSEQKRADKDKISPLKKCMKAKTLGSSLDEKNHKLVSHQLSASRLLESNLFMPVPSLANGSANSTLSWNSSKVIDYCNLSDSHDVIQFGILHETIPDTAGNISLNSTASIDTPDAKPYERKVESNELHLDSPKFGLNAMERKTDLDSIRNRYEALKRTFVTSFSEDRTDYSPLSHVAKQKSESSLPIETRNVFSPLDKGLTLDLEYLTTPSPRDRKLSLPQLISFSPCEDDVGCRTTEDFSDVFESQGPGKINETFDFTHSVSDLQKVTEEGVGQLIIL